MDTNQKPKILTEDEIKEGLKNLPGWERKGNMIAKQFKLKDFSDATSFVAKLAPFCNKVNHHPDVQINYSKVKFELTRYDVGGKLTDKDFKVAREIERQYQKVKG